VLPLLALLLFHAGEVKRLKAYKAWATQVAATPRPSSDPLAPPKKSSKKAKADASDEMALVAAIKNKVRSTNGLGLSSCTSWAGGVVGGIKLELNGSNKAKGGASDGTSSSRQEQSDIIH
jgi:hypothetical protein